MTTSKNSAIFFSFWGGGGGPSLALDEAMNRGVGEPSNDDTHTKIWRKFWSLNMPNKVNFFLLESMPKYTSHKSKLMQNVCEACGFGIESSGHIF